MNIFMGNKDYLKDVSPDSLLEAGKEFFTVMREIRVSLGSRQYRLDNYVERTLSAINHRLAYENADAGFEEFGSLNRICTEVLDGSGDVDHPVFQIVKDAVDKYRVKFQERATLRAIAAVAAFPEFMKFAVQRFVQDESDNLGEVLDSMKQQELFKEISAVVGDREMERLNYAIKRRFLIVPATNAYLQGLSDNYLYCFLHRDNETERKVFQIMLDENQEA